MSSDNNKHVPKPDSTTQPLPGQPSSTPATSGSLQSGSAGGLSGGSRPAPAPLDELSTRAEYTPFANPQLSPALRQEIIANTSPTASAHQAVASVDSGAPSPRRSSVGGSSTSSNRADPRKRPGLFQRLTGGSLRSNSNSNANDVANLPLSLRPSMVEAARQPSIRIRRRPVGSSQLSEVQDAGSVQSSGRRRSSSDPARGQLVGSAPLRPVSTASGGAPHLQQIQEGSTIDSSMPNASRVATVETGGPADDNIAQEDETGPIDEDEYHRELVDILDTVDPEVSTLTTLTNVQNSLFVPDLGRFLSRRPVYNLSPSAAARQPTFRKAPTRVQEQTITEEPSREAKEGREETETKKPQRKDPRRPQLTHTSTIDSTMSESRFAVLPHGRDLSGWSQAEKDELNDHVRHMLHSRRSKFKRGMKGFGQYVRRPLGFLVTLYATLITLFGLAWVLFLIGWINVGGKQLELINIIDNVLVALFAIMGDGLAPFRIWDTYNMAFITHYHRKSWKLRKKRALPKLPNKNDLPELREEEVGIEESKVGDYVVLSDYDHAKLLKHENRFCRSHTFYKPHETETHFAFPIKLLVTIVVLLDMHSCLQISLGACTWGINYKVRPFALTTVILCCSITCNITAGVLIAVGDRRTRKKDVIERMMRQELTEEAIQKVEKRRIEKLEEEHGVERVAAARKSLQMQRAAKQDSTQSEPTGLNAEVHQAKGSVSGKLIGIFGVTRKGDKAPPVDKGQHRAPGTTTMEGGKEVQRSVSEPLAAEGPSSSQQNALELERERQKQAGKSKEDMEKEKAKEAKKKEKEAERAREREVEKLRDADRHHHHPHIPHHHSSGSGGGSGAGGSSVQSP